VGSWGLRFPAARAVPDAGASFGSIRRLAPRSQPAPYARLNNRVRSSVARTQPGSSTACLSAGRPARPARWRRPPSEAPRSLQAQLRHPPPHRVEGSDPEQGANLHCLPAEHASSRCHKGDNASRLYEILRHCLIAVRCARRLHRLHCTKWKHLWPRQNDSPGNRFRRGSILEPAHFALARVNASELYFEQTITCPYVCRNSSPYG
jgi:hypothetical protein